MKDAIQVLADLSALVFVVSSMLSLGLSLTLQKRIAATTDVILLTPNLVLASEQQSTDSLPATGKSFQERPAPAHLRPNEITILHIYGSVFYASADILRTALPSPYTADRSVVILSLRGRNKLGSTFINLLQRYAQELYSHNSKLMLSSVLKLPQNLIRSYERMRF